MSTCEVKTGLFVLSACKRPSTQSCHNCGKSTCDSHGRADATGDFFCFECVVELNPKSSKKQKGRNRDDDWDDTATILSVYYYRDRFYDRDSFQPFDEQDYAGFDEAGGFLAMGDDLDEGGFFDS